VKLKGVEPGSISSLSASGHSAGTASLTLSSLEEGGGVIKASDHTFKATSRLERPWGHRKYGQVIRTIVRVTTV
jgi:hypothetical protein